MGNNVCGACACMRVCKLLLCLVFLALMRTVVAWYGERLFLFGYTHTTCNWRIGNHWGAGLFKFLEYISCTFARGAATAAGAIAARAAETSRSMFMSTNHWPPSWRSLSGVDATGLLLLWGTPLIPPSVAVATAPPPDDGPPPVAVVGTAPGRLDPITQSPMVEKYMTRLSNPVSTWLGLEWLTRS
jgi:hypothetical protein